MPKRSHLLSIAAALIVAAAPALAAGPKIPEIPRNVPIIISGELPSKSLRGGSYAVPDSYYGIFSHQKSSNVLGALGALGGIVHGAKLQGAAKAKAGNGALFENNLADMLGEADPEFSRSPEKPDDRIELVPAATFFFTSDRDFAMTCTMEASIFKRGRKADDFRITISGPPLYTLSDTDLPDKLRDGLRACMKRSAEVLALLKQYGNSDFHRASITAPNGRKVVWHLLKPAYPHRFIVADGSRITEYGAPGATRSAELEFDSPD